MTGVLHLDDALIAVEKPAGLASIPERDLGADCLLAQLTAQHGRLFVVHRLDKEVSGVLVFARTAESHRALCRQFEARTVSKTYLALVHGEPADDSGRIEAPLRSFGSGRTGIDAVNGKPSVTTWRVLQRRPGTALLAVQPLTGRRHQIRAHLCSIGHPIAGDDRYDTPPEPLPQPPASSAFPRVMLHALSLECEHPVTGQRLTLRAPAPDAFGEVPAPLTAAPRWPASHDPAERAALTFNSASDCYDAEPLQFWSHFGERTVARLQLAPGARVLDVPCGTGASAIPAGRAVGPDGFVLACDVAERMLALAREKAARQGLRQVHFRLADMRALGEPDESFDAVVCVFGVFFVPDMAEQVRRLWRLVKPGGQLAITTWGPRLFSPAIERLEQAIAAERPELVPKDHPWERLTEPQELSALMREAGITETELRPVKVELRRHPLKNPGDWWTIVRGGGMRWTLEQLGPQASARVRDDNLAFLAAQHVTALRTDALYALARKS